MIGAIIGDIVGSIYEFQNTKSKNFEFITEQNHYTDDTVLTIAVAEWLLYDPDHTQQKLEECLVRWGQAHNAGYGGMFYAWLFQHGTMRGERHPYNSWGNGSAMRCSACGWLANSLWEAEELAKKSAEITHNHPEGIKGAQATAAAIYLARTGVKRSEIKTYIKLRYGYFLDETIAVPLKFKSAL